MINNIKNQFIATEEWTYMDVAAQAILSNTTRDAINQYLDDIQQNGGTTDDQWFGKLESTREKFTQFIHAKPQEIAYTKNTSEGLNIIANAFPWNNGDNIVLCQDIEHPNNIYVWYNLEKLGVEVRVVSSEKGFVTPEDFLDKMDERTRMVTVSTVSFVPGQRVNLEKLAYLCKNRNIFLLVDGAQSLGVLDLDVSKLPIDALVVPTYKGILGLYGMGFLYCREEWIESLQPVYLSRFSIGSGEDSHESAFGGTDYQLHTSARRFEIGHYNIVGVFAAEASLDLLMNIGVGNIEDHVLKLASEFTKGLEDIRLNVSSGRDYNDLSSIVTIGEWGKGNHYQADDPEITRLFHYLQSEKVKISLRRGLIRFSLHMYNTQEDIHHVLNLLELERSRTVN